jgi:hypothetical protein
MLRVLYQQNLSIWWFFVSGNSFTDTGHEKSPVLGPGILYKSAVFVCLYEHGPAGAAWRLFH